MSAKFYDKRKFWRGVAFSSFGFATFNTFYAGYEFAQGVKSTEEEATIVYFGAEQSHEGFVKESDLHAERVVNAVTLVIGEVAVGCAILHLANRKESLV